MKNRSQSGWLLPSWLFASQGVASVRLPGPAFASSSKSHSTAVKLGAACNKTKQARNKGQERDPGLQGDQQQEEQYHWEKT